MTGRPFAKGNTFAKGGARPNSGPKGKARAEALAFIEAYLVKIKGQKPMPAAVWAFGELVKEAMKPSPKAARVKALEKVMVWCVGRPRQAVDLNIGGMADILGQTLERAKLAAAGKKFD